MPGRERREKGEEEEEERREEGGRRREEGGEGVKTRYSRQANSVSFTAFAMNVYPSQAELSLNTPD
ncbi:hypothetical protein QLY78_20390, partial [Cronobacter sakazakii]|nr:hypothetical protein [Cronobacter sakazakii]